MKTLGFLVIMTFSKGRYLLVEVDNSVRDGGEHEGIIRNPYFRIIAFLHYIYMAHLHVCPFIFTL